MSFTERIMRDSPDWQPPWWDPDPKVMAERFQATIANDTDVYWFSCYGYITWHSKWILTMTSFYFASTVWWQLLQGRRGRRCQQSAHIHQPGKPFHKNTDNKGSKYWQHNISPSFLSATNRSLWRMPWLHGRNGWWPGCGYHVWCLLWKLWAFKFSIPNIVHIKTRDKNCTPIPIPVEKYVKDVPTKEERTFPSGSTNHMWQRHLSRVEEVNAAKFISNLNREDIEKIVYAAKRNFDDFTGDRYRQGMVYLPFTVGSQGKGLPIQHIC